MTKKIISFLLLSLIALYAITSTGNIIRLVETVHHGWVAWTLGASLGFTLALSSFIAAMAQTRKLFVHALIVAGLSGIMSAIFQTYMYMADGAEWYIAALLGFGIPLIGEVGLALLDAAYMDEHSTLETAKLENETLARMKAILSETRAFANQVEEENQRLYVQLSTLQSQVVNGTDSHHPTVDNGMATGMQNGIPSETVLENPSPEAEPKPEKQRSPQTLAKLQEAAAVASQYSISSYRELADRLGWPPSTAHRYWNMAIEDELITVPQGA